MRVLNITKQDIDRVPGQLPENNIIKKKNYDGTIHNLANKQNVVKILALFQKMIKSGGWLLLHTFSKPSIVTDQTSKIRILVDTGSEVCVYSKKLMSYHNTKAFN